MEDFYETRIDGVDGETVGLFGVFDGIVAYFSNFCLLIVSCRGYFISILY
jgi:hypothetical protein